ncbi:MAG: acyl-CoA dehydrogenase family protein [Chloroflexi bacterium]|nr:acyl-CoA dehydrogenase family protein [Chloroflexota bacterium]
MDFRFSPEDAALRQEALEFVRREWDPQGYDTQPLYGFDWHHTDPGYRELTKAFAKKLVRKGWWTMHWPTEHGGKGASIATQLAYREAMAYAGAPVALGGGLVAPVLMISGQDWQKREFLPKLANAEMEFSQAFSEPNAGSDLANLQTRAVRDGDDYILNGQKIWGVYREEWMHIMVRTDPNAPKHRGITYLLAPLKDGSGNYLPGVTVRAIPDALGRHRWDELFLEDVRVPARTILGEENRGWYVAMTTLSFERSNIQAPASLIRLIEEFIDFCRTMKGSHGQSPLDDPRLRHQLAHWRLELETARMLSYRVAWMQSQGQVPVRESSMTKIWGDSAAQGLYRFLSHTLQEYGNLLPGNRLPLPGDGYINSRAFSTITTTIGGGTNEIQRNIIAQRGLGLPR